MNKCYCYADIREDFLPHYEAIPGNSFKGSILVPTNTCVFLSDPHNPGVLIEVIHTAHLGTTGCNSKSVFRRHLHIYLQEWSSDRNSRVKDWTIHGFCIAGPSKCFEDFSPGLQFLASIGDVGRAVKRRLWDIKKSKKWMKQFHFAEHPIWSCSICLTLRQFTSRRFTSFERVCFRMLHISMECSDV